MPTSARDSICAKLSSTCTRGGGRGKTRKGARAGVKKKARFFISVGLRRTLTVCMSSTQVCLSGASSRPSRPVTLHIPGGRSSWLKPHFCGDVATLLSSPQILTLPRRLPRVAGTLYSYQIQEIHTGKHHTGTGMI
jgi:hypothetical protein